MPGTYAFKSGTRADLGLAAADTGGNPDTIVCALVAITKTELRVAKGQIIIAFKPFCTTCRKVGHLTKACKRAAHNAAHFHASQAMRPLPGETCGAGPSL